MKTLTTSFISADGLRVNAKIEIRTVDNNETRDWDTLEKVGSHIEISITGKVGSHSGQVYGAFTPTEAQQRFVDFWREYHLNANEPGTKAQFECLRANTNNHDYDNCVEVLKANNLYEDRGYRYGTGWLYRPVPVEELDEILAGIEKENQERIENAPEPIYDVEEDDDQTLIDAIEEHLDCGSIEAERVLAFLRREKLNFDEIAFLRINDTELWYRDELYFVGDSTDLNDAARNYLDVEQWKEAVSSGVTLSGYSDWVEDVLSENEPASLLAFYDGKYDMEEVNGNAYTIFRQ